MVLYPSMTAFITVVVGTAVFVLGQMIVVLFVRRIETQARTVEEIAQALVIYAREYSNPLQDGQTVTDRLLERLHGAQDNLRRLAAILRSTGQTLKWYPLFEQMRLVLPRDRVLKASGCLIGLSNNIPPRATDLQDVIRLEKEIKALLHIEIEP